MRALSNIIWLISAIVVALMSIAIISFSFFKTVNPLAALSKQAKEVGETATENFAPSIEEKPIEFTLSYKYDPFRRAPPYSKPILEKYTWKLSQTLLSSNSFEINFVDKDDHPKTKNIDISAGKLNIVYAIYNGISEINIKFDDCLKLFSQGYIHNISYDERNKQYKGYILFLYDDTNRKLIKMNPNEADNYVKVSTLCYKIKDGVKINSLRNGDILKQFIEKDENEKINFLEEKAETISRTPDLDLKVDALKVGKCVAFIKKGEIADKKVFPSNRDFCVRYRDLVWSQLNPDRFYWLFLDYNEFMYKVDRGFIIKNNLLEAVSPDIPRKTINGWESEIFLTKVDVISPKDEGYKDLVNSMNKVYICNQYFAPAKQIANNVPVKTSYTIGEFGKLCWIEEEKIENIVSKYFEKANTEFKYSIYDLNIIDSGKVCKIPCEKGLIAIEAPEEICNALNGQIDILPIEEKNGLLIVKLIKFGYPNIYVFPAYINNCETIKTLPKEGNGIYKNYLIINKENWGNIKVTVNESIDNGFCCIKWDNIKEQLLFNTSNDPAGCTGIWVERDCLDLVK
ncbi:NEQ137 [Nanoarchaeum equitans Kin4-M]|uniref:NEQ137 n=1 Tax=Nanoarchaeum equitans (strain Kin4-M) TaxID=228908 RepID=Q74NA3_NANEQ|nr:NEQ137 [Nanoarchaeum equitans Kin4-M]